MIPLREV